MKGIFAPFICLILLAFLFSCEKEEEKFTLFYGYQYAPLAVGQERTFAIDSIIYDEFSNTVDTFRIYQRESVTDSSIDLEGRLTYSFVISQRLSDSLPWRKIKVGSLRRDNSQFERTLDNQTQLLMVFPITETAAWNSNTHNALAKQEFSYQKLYVPFSVEGVRYDSTITVLQLADENLIEKKHTEEKYAPTIGLIYRCDLNIRTTFDGDILSGYDCRWSLIEK